MSPPANTANPHAPRWRPWAGIGVGVLVAITFFASDWPTRIVAIVLGACILQGLWRGAAQALALLVGMIVAALVATPSARTIEPLVASLSGSAGLLNRFLAVLLAGSCICAIVGGVVGWGTRRYLRDRPALRSWNHAAGGVLGLLEGIVLSLIVLWIPLALEPIAAARAAGAQPGAPANQMGERVRSWASAIRASGVGGFAAATNPAENSPALALINDLAEVLKDPDAYEAFLRSPAVKRLHETPSVQRALDRLRADPHLTSMFEGNALTPEVLRAVVESPAVLDVLDHSTVLSDITPLVADLRTAIAEARDVVRRGPR